MYGFVNEDGSFDYDGLIKAQKYSALMGYRVATIELELHEWDMSNADDRLIGVSLTGMMDFMNATKMSMDDMRKLLEHLRVVAHDSANHLADFLNLRRPTLHTAIKPSGTISQLPTVSSGVHYSHSEYYIRRVRVNALDPIAKALVADGFNWYPENGQSIENHTTKVFEFPVKAPQGKTKYDVSAIEQLELYKMIMESYVDHNASNTIHVRDNEWDEVKKWTKDNWDSIVGVTFLSLDDSFYELLPYESITKDQYEDMLSKTPAFHPDTINQFEKFDEEFDILDSECESGVCPIR